MSALSEEYGDVTDVLSFDDAKANFMAAARYGLDARFRWAGGRTTSAESLILEHLLPLAAQGLRAKGIVPGDVDLYLGIIEERVRSGRTGSQWVFDALADFGERARPEERFRALVASMYERCLEGRPVHEWRPASPGEPEDLRSSCRFVEQVMTTDLFTVRPDDLVDLAASLMDWEHIRHVPVEGPQGRLVGLVSHRQLLRLVGRGLRAGQGTAVVRDIMTPDPVTVRPESTTLEAIHLMRRRKVSCLPVVDERSRLVGIVSERDFIDVTARLLEELLSDDG